MAAPVYGFSKLLDNPNKRIAELDPTQLQSAIAYSQAQHDSELDTILNLFSEETTAIQLKFNAGQIITENQPLDEYGRSKKLKSYRSQYTGGFPIFSSGQATGMTYLVKAKMTIQHFNDIMDAIYRGDFKWTRNRVLASMFINTTRQFDDYESYDGTITINPLANGDAVPYAFHGQEDVGPDNHYLGFANPISDANNPFPTIRNELIEHDLNSGEVVTFISSSLVNPSPTTGVKALTGFVEWIGGYDLIGYTGRDPELTIPVFPSIIQILAPLKMTLPPTSKYLGRVDYQHIVEWPILPSGYGFSVTTGGPRPLLRRVDPETELRGFKPVATREDFPFFEDQWMRRMGFGAWNRVSAVVFQIGSGTYTIPSVYQNIRWA